MSPGHSAGLPSRSALDDSGLHLALVDIAPDELKEPFLHETVQRLAKPPTIHHIPADRLGHGADSTAPVGLVFHVARCGSTLVSQMLKQHHDLVVYSEPLAINELLVGSRGADRDRRVTALRSLGAHFASHAGSAGRRYVLKLSSWNLLHAPMLLEAFPRTPWALCVRDPLEVCVSLQSSPPSWLRPENAALFATTVDVGDPSAGLEQRSARFFAAFCQAATRLPFERGLIIPYEALPQAVPEVLLARFGLLADPAVKERMANSARLDSKARPGQVAAFVPDAQRKRASASESLRAAVDAWADPAFQALVTAWRSASGSTNAAE